MAALSSTLLFYGCDKEQKSAAENACGSGIPRILCEGDGFEVGYDEVIKHCIENVEEAKEISDLCEESILDLLNCLGNLACMDISTWRDDKCGEMTVDYCGPQAAVFCEQCPGVWYAEEE